MFLTGEVQRSISSTALDISRSGSARRAAYWSGWRSNCSIPPLRVWRVVSSPPMRISSASLRMSVVGQPLPIDRRVRQDTDEVVGGLLAALFDDSHGEHAEVHERLRAHFPVDFGHLRAQGGKHVVGPLQEHAALLGEHTQHVADDGHRQRRGQIMHEVALAALTHRVNEVVTELTYRCPLVLHPLAGETGVDQLAPQQMHRIVHVDHHRHRWDDIRTDALGIGEEFGLLLGLEDSLVGRHRGQPVAIPEHWLVLPHPAVRRA